MQTVTLSQLEADVVRAQDALDQLNELWAPKARNAHYHSKREQLSAQLHAAHQALHEFRTRQHNERRKLKGGLDHL